MSFSLHSTYNERPRDQSAREETKSLKHAHSFNIAVKLNIDSDRKKKQKNAFRMFSVYNTKTADTGQTENEINRKK